MKKMSLEQMEVIQGGQMIGPIENLPIEDPMTWTWKQHILCGLSGALAGGGFGGVAVYLICLQLLVP